MSVNYHYNESNQRITFYPRGGFTEKVAAIVNEVESKHPFDTLHAIVFDFKNTEFIDSRGIGLLFIIHDKTRGTKAKISIVNANTTILSLLKRSGLDTIYQI